MSKYTGKKYTISEYIKIADGQFGFFEYENGKVTHLLGDGIRNSTIASQANNAIENAATQKKIPMTTARYDRVYIEPSNSFLYPDAMVFLEDVERPKQDEFSFSNPNLIIEVFSNSTEGHDRGNKFHNYCYLPSFQEYLLINGDRPIVDVLYREEPAVWKLRTTIGLDQSIYLHTLDAHISMADLY